MPQQVLRTWELADRIERVATTRLTRALYDLVDQSLTYAVENGSLFEAVTYLRGTYDVIYTGYREMSRDAFVGAGGLITKSFENYVSMADQYTTTYLAPLGVLAARNFRNEVAGLIRQMVREGKGIREGARLLRKEMGGLTRRSAERIMSTEVMGAINHSSLAVTRQEARRQGMTGTKSWYAHVDKKTRDSHEAAHRQRRGLDEQFNVGGRPAMYPGDTSLPPEERIRCRCTMTYDLA